MAPPSWIPWLVNTKQTITTINGKTVEVWEFRHEDDETILSDFACHYRNHYCTDDEIDMLRRGSPYTRAEYLINVKFPDARQGLGPAIRAGDFGEILVADYAQHVLGFDVPRTRYDRKTVHDESTKGSDVVGFKLIDGVDHPSEDDSLLVVETKTQFSGENPENRLQDAVNDSKKDPVRLGESLNAIKQRLIDRRDAERAQIVERFQSPEDSPYVKEFGAVALFSTKVFDPEVLAQTDTTGHPNDADVSLLVIHGQEMMVLVHGLYDRAANEA